MIKIKDVFYTSPKRSKGMGKINYVRIMNKRDFSLVYESSNLGDVINYVREHDYEDEKSLYVIINNDEVVK